MESTLKEKYEIWMEKAVADPDLKPELEAMAGDEAKIYYYILWKKMAYCCPNSGSGYYE